jgi:hypothetical protein
MDTTTGEIISAAELARRVEALPPSQRELERAKYVKLSMFEARMLGNPAMTPAERIAFKARRNLRCAMKRAASGGG